MLKKPPNLHIICVAAAVAAALVYGAWRWRREGRAQNDALQKYLEQMGQLLTEEGLRSSEKGSDVRVSARSQTLTVLQGLGPDRKQKPLRFLYESHLIGKDNSIVSLAGADLSEAKLRGAKLSEADLSEAKLRGADLSKADLNEAKLSEADLRGADLNGADLREADLREADLMGAILQEADLNGADLRGVDLNGADLNGATLNGADLRGAKVTQGQLATCRLQGTTMPDGSKHD